MLLITPISSNVRLQTPILSSSRLNVNAWAAIQLQKKVLTLLLGLSGDGLACGLNGERVVTLEIVTVE